MATQRDIEWCYAFFQLGIKSFDLFDLKKLNDRLARLNNDHANDRNWTIEKENRRNKITDKIATILVKYPLYKYEIRLSPYYSCIIIYRDEHDSYGVHI